MLCIKTMSVKGGVYAYEPHEAKKKNVLLCVYMAPTTFLYTYILLSWHDFVFDINVTCVLRRAIQCLLG